MFISEFHDSRYCQKSAKTKFGGKRNLTYVGFAASRISFSAKPNISAAEGSGQH